MAGMSAVDVLALAFAALDVEGQEEAFARITDIRLTRLASAESESSLMIRSLRRVAEVADGELSPDLYRRLRRQLVDAGEQIHDFNTVTRHFGGWRLAKEALGLADVATPRKIDARFRSRLRGRQRTFQQQELERAMADCVAELGRVPLLAEYDEWRLAALTLARARGEDVRVPSASVFRRRHRSWQRALLACGYSPSEVYVRLEPTLERRARLSKVDRYSEATLRETLLRCASELGHPPVVEEFEKWRRHQLLQRSADGVILPSDSPYRRRFGGWEAALLYFGFSPEEIEGRLVDGRARSSAASRAHRAPRQSG
jgi:hypothetical protein